MSTSGSATHLPGLPLEKQSNITSKPAPNMAGSGAPVHPGLPPAMLREPGLEEWIGSRIPGRLSAGFQIPGNQQDLGEVLGHPAPFDRGAHQREWSIQAEANQRLKMSPPSPVHSGQYTEEWSPSATCSVTRQPWLLHSEGPRHWPPLCP